MPCIHCSREPASYHFHALEVLTLHVRDLGGEKRVQALGEYVDFSVCRDCAQERFRKATGGVSTWLPPLLPFLAIGLAGAGITLYFLPRKGVFLLLGLSMLAAGLLGIFGTCQKLSRQRSRLLRLSAEDALRECAWECAVDAAPHKSDINDITYIPIDEQTLARKNGDLMILYDLLPQIAVQAWNRIHGIPENSENT